MEKMTKNYTYRALDQKRANDKKLLLKKKVNLKNYLILLLLNV